MRVVWIGGVLAVLSWRAVPAFSRSLEAEVRDLIAGEGLRAADVGVAIVSECGEMAVSINGKEPFQPASNQKVLTTAAALSLLGPGHTFETTLSSRAPLRGGRIAGDLTVRGRGDPNISSRFFEGGPAALFRQWARELRAKGLERIDGDLVADDTFFDDVRLPPSWDAAQEETWYSAQVSALSLNDNCLDITVRPAGAAGRPARVEVIPASPLVEVEGAPETVSRGETRVIVHRKPGTNRVTVQGQIALRHTPWSGNITVDDPATVFASALAAVFREEGIAIEGKARRVDREASAKGKAGPAAPVHAAAGPGEATLLRHTSTLLQDLPIILKRSQNLHAEILLKVLGAVAGGEGSLAGGERAIRRFLRSKGIPDQPFALGDGSGLSHENRVSAEILARVLQSVRGEKYFEDYLKSLPVAGEDGTLEKRFRDSPSARGNVHAKTGYIKGVSCLSGYVVKGQKVWCFSVLVNGLRGGAQRAKALQERISELVYREM